MPGKRPTYRLFLSDESGQMPVGDDGFRVELCALWETRRPDKHGNPMYSGKTGRGDQYALLVQVPPKNEQRFDGDAPPDSDAPF